VKWPCSCNAVLALCTVTQACFRPKRECSRHYIGCRAIAELFIRCVQGLTLSVQHSTFINSGGPAIAWSPAVPGSLVGCTATGQSDTTERFYSSCDFSHMTGNAPPRMLPYSNATDDAAATAQGSSEGERVPVIRADMPPVTVKSRQFQGSGGVQVLHMHAYVPPEAFAIALTVSEVRSIEKIARARCTVTAQVSVIGCTAT
jgi:hypothetical protein